MTLRNYQWLDEKEIQGALKAAVEAGEYIESLGKTDLAEYTQEEFETLLLVICNAMFRHSMPF